MPSSSPRRRRRTRRWRSPRSTAGFTSLSSKPMCITLAMQTGSSRLGTTPARVVQVGLHETVRPRLGAQCSRHAGSAEALRYVSVVSTTRSSIPSSGRATSCAATTFRRRAPARECADARADARGGRLPTHPSVICRVRRLVPREPGARSEPRARTTRAAGRAAARRGDRRRLVEPRPCRDRVVAAGERSALRSRLDPAARRI